jgi:excisionase family DNA binding protein
MREVAMNMQKSYLSIEEVAGLLDVNYQLIYKLVRTGELPSARVGKVYRVLRVDLDAYLERSKTNVTGGICSACGKAYASRLSLAQACEECGEPLCADCWSRKGTHYCRQHQPKAPPAKSKKT